MMMKSSSLSPDSLPHVEPVQRFGSVRRRPGQTHNRRQPIRDVDELSTDGSRLLYEWAAHKGHAPDSALPQRPLPATQRPVISSRQGLTSVI